MLLGCRIKSVRSDAALAVHIAPSTTPPSVLTPSKCLVSSLSSGAVSNASFHHSLRLLVEASPEWKTVMRDWTVCQPMLGLGGDSDIVVGTFSTDSFFCYYRLSLVTEELISLMIRLRASRSEHCDGTYGTSITRCLTGTGVYHRSPMPKPRRRPVRRVLALAQVLLP